MCGNSGTVLENVEKLFYKTLEETKSQIENYIEEIKKIQTSGNKTGKRLETQKNIKLQQVEQMKKKRKKISDLIEDSYYDAEEEREKMREAKQLQNRIKELENEIQELEEKEGESEIEHVEKVLININKFFEGKKDPKTSEKVLNEILTDFISDITYKKSGRWAEIEVEVHLKDDIQEVVFESEDLHKTA